MRKNGVPPGQVSIRIRVDAGSLNERDGEQGFAHLIEHLLFRQSKYLADGAAIATWQRLGASFGSGASGSLFGATGSANFLSRSTAALATVFFVCTLALAYMGNTNSNRPAATLSPAASCFAMVDRCSRPRTVEVRASTSGRRNSTPYR